MERALTSKNKNDETLLQDLSDNFQSISLFCSLFISLLIFIFQRISPCYYLKAKNTSGL